jgi:hypothetical protein
LKSATSKPTLPSSSFKQCAPERSPEVMTMPRSVKEILQHADELAERFENCEPKPADELDSGAVVLLRATVKSDRRPRGTSSTPSGPPVHPGCHRRPSALSSAQAVKPPARSIRASRIARA